MKSMIFLNLLYVFLDTKVQKDSLAEMSKNSTVIILIMLAITTFGIRMNY